MAASGSGGDKSAYAHVGEALARRGVLTLVVNYRLTPTVRHPGHVQDAARATAWALENVERFGGRKDRVFLSGHSAGGHLVTLLLFDEGYLRSIRLRAAPLNAVKARRKKPGDRRFSRQPQRASAMGSTQGVPRSTAASSLRATRSGPMRAVPTIRVPSVRSASSV